LGERSREVERLKKEKRRVGEGKKRGAGRLVAAASGLLFFFFLARPGGARSGERESK
jgi:hypothetical protein